MAFALSIKKIRCINCEYTGKAKLKGQGGAWILWLALLVVSFFFWPLFVVVGIMFLWLMFRPAQQVCPKCEFPNPIPL